MATTVRPVERAEAIRAITSATLERAIRGGELVLHYQPKVDITTQRLVAVEALVRWQQPNGRLVFPDNFIPLAEESGLMPALTGVVVRQALDQFARWHGQGLALSVAVNVSASLLSDPRALPFLAAELAQRRVNPAAVVLEITESTVMADPDLALGALRQLSAMGVRISIDDFGTGYSSLAYLSRLPVNELKIDRGFVTNLATDEDSAAIVRSTIGLSHALGHEVVAEGVEDLAAFGMLRHLGCDLAQGYLISRPLAADQFEAWVAADWPRVAARLTGTIIARAPADELYGLSTDQDDLSLARGRAYQRLTAASRPADVAAALRRFVAEVGGTTCEAEDCADSSGDLLYLDISLGAADPVMPAAQRGSRARRALEETLPGVVESGRRMIHLLEHQAV